jgi:hypothetical protein
VFGPDDARQAFSLKARLLNNEDIGHQARRAKQQAHNQSARTVDELIAEYVLWLQVPEQEDWLPKGQTAPRLGTWDEQSG